MFYDEGTDEYIFLYLEYGDGGTTRQVYANRMEFNDDGTIKTLIPDMRGVGYLAASQETRPNLALQSHCLLYTSSIFRCLASSGTAFFIPSITHWAI